MLSPALEHVWRPKVEEIIENFKFKKVKKAMKALDWKWGSGADAKRPSIKELKGRARELLWQGIEGAYQYDSGQCVTGTGGLMVTVVAKPTERWIELSFVLEEWTSD